MFSALPNVKCGPERLFLRRLGPLRPDWAVIGSEAGPWLQAVSKVSRFALTSAAIPRPAAIWLSKTAVGISPAGRCRIFLPHPPPFSPPRVQAEKGEIPFHCKTEDYEPAQIGRTAFQINTH